MIGILDYGVGNVGAFLRIFHSQNINAIPVKVPRDFTKVDKVILPGRGHFLPCALGILETDGVMRGKTLL